MPDKRPGFYVRPEGLLVPAPKLMVSRDLAREPQRIADFYRTRSYRLEPVGLAYLWPVTG